MAHARFFVVTDRAQPNSQTVSETSFLVMIAAEGCAMADELTADEIRTLLRLEPHATCGAMSTNWRRSIRRLPPTCAPSRTRCEIRLRAIAASPSSPLALPSRHGSARAA